MPLGLKDALLTQTGTLPAAASSTTVSSSLNLGLGIHGETAWVGEFEIDAPALTNTQLPTGGTVTYNVIVSTAANLSSPTVIGSAVLTQTGAGSGAVAATARFRPPFQLPLSSGAAQPYIGLQAVTNGSASNCSAASMTLAPVF